MLQVKLPCTTAGLTAAAAVLKTDAKVSITITGERKEMGAQWSTTEPEVGAGEVSAVASSPPVVSSYCFLVISSVLPKKVHTTDDERTGTD
jgi:hypothetical protein